MVLSLFFFFLILGRSNRCIVISHLVLAVSHPFDMLFFHICPDPYSSLISFEISTLIYDYLRAYCLTSMHRDFLVVALLMISNLILLWSEIIF